MGNHLATMRVPDGGIVIKNIDKEDGAKSEWAINKTINFQINQADFPVLLVHFPQLISFPHPLVAGGIKNPLLEKRRQKAAREAAAASSK